MQFIQITQKCNLPTNHMDMTKHEQSIVCLAEFKTDFPAGENI